MNCETCGNPVANGLHTLTNNPNCHPKPSRAEGEDSAPARELRKHLTSLDLTDAGSLKRSAPDLYKFWMSWGRAMGFERNTLEFAFAFTAERTAALTAERDRLGKSYWAQCEQISRLSKEREALKKYLCAAHWEIAPEKPIDTCLECALIQQIEDRRRAEAESDRLREYAQHKPTCPAPRKLSLGASRAVADSVCDCGLAKLLTGGAAENDTTKEKP